MITVFDRQCRNCLFSDDRLVSAVAAEEIVEACVLEEMEFACHADPRHMCRGFFERHADDVGYIRVAKKVGRVLSVERGADPRLKSYRETGEERYGFEIDLEGGETVGFKVDQVLKASEKGIAAIGLTRELRVVVQAVPRPGEVLVKIDGKPRYCPASWFEAVAAGEEALKNRKPVQDRFDKCLFAIGDRVRFHGQAEGFEGRESVGRVVAVVPPRVEPMVALKEIGADFEQTHSFRLDRNRLQASVRTHRYWIEAKPTEWPNGRPCLFLKTNQWVLGKVEESR